MSEWKIKRGADELSIGDTVALRAMAKQGKLKPEDYVLNPVLQQWMYARDAAELEGIFASLSSNAKAQQYNRLSFGLGFVGLLLLFLFPFAGVMVLIAAIGPSVMYYVNQEVKGHRVKGSWDSRIRIAMLNRFPGKSNLIILAQSAAPLYRHAIRQN